MGSEMCIRDRARKLANHGRTGKYDHDVEGFNSRLDTLQAAILRVKLRYLRQWTDARRDRALYYDQKLSEIKAVKRPELPVREQHVFHLYVTRVQNRDQVLEHLKSQGVDAIVHYPVALPMLKAYAHMGFKPSDFPVATKLQNEILSLPLFAEITTEEQNSIVSPLQKFV